MTIQILLSLSLIVFIHEMGHYLAARAFGIRVTKFYLFFDAWGFKLFSFKRGDTEFGVGWLPLGGYCQISGMIDENPNADGSPSEPQPWEYRAKPAWQRLIVVFGGIFLNFVTGILILSALLLGRGFLSNDEVSRYGISPSIVGQEIGFERGDRILAVDGRRVVRFQDAQGPNVLFGAEVTVLRGNDTIAIVTPRDTHQRLMEADVQLFTTYRYPVIVLGAQEGSIGEQMGLLPQDRILKINNEDIHSFASLQAALGEYKNQDVQVTIGRNSETLVFNTTLDNTGRLGVFIHRSPRVSEMFEMTPYTALTALKFGTRDGVSLLVANARGLGQVASGQVRATESIQGPIGMARMFGGNWDWQRFWHLTGIISLILAFMNFLPIPALDGGHIVFTMWEIITRRKPSDKFLMATQQIGMVLLLALMVFVLGNDIFRIFR